MSPTRTAQRTAQAGADAPAAEDSTRLRVLDAVVSCIVERGFYRASSNEIARTAGVTWGVIQHHFGTREGLLLAALEHAGRRLERLVDEADVTGPTTADRLLRYLYALHAHYGQPAYLAHLQISLELGRDPGTSAQTARVLAETERRVDRRLRALQERAVGAPLDPVRRTALFHACRGFVLSTAVYDATGPGAARAGRPALDPQLRLLATALAATLP